MRRAEHGLERQSFLLKHALVPHVAASLLACTEEGLGTVQGTRGRAHPSLLPLRGAGGAPPSAARDGCVLTCQHRGL